jgi:hypothetical protein
LLDEEISPLGIDFPHPLDVTQEKALGDKTSSVAWAIGDEC